VHRDYEPDDRRRRFRTDDDPRDDPRERYGNEEDQYGRAYRRAYADQDLPRRMQNDRPYNEPGYEPEFGRPGQRENVDLERGDPYREYRERYAADRYGSDRGRPDPRREYPGSQQRGSEPWQGGYYGQGRRWTGEPFDGEDQRRTRDGGQDRYREAGRSGRSERYGPSSYGGQSSSGFAPSPYDEGDVSSWYGGDTGMGDPGSSRPGYDRQGYERQGQRQSGGWQGQSQQSAFGGGSRSGQFRGHGPRGYQRSDDRIREDVCELLTHHGEIDAREMDVEVQGATVVLRGTADSGRTRRLAEELVEGIPGVRDVRNELRVNRYPSASRDAMVDTGTFAQDRGGLRESHTPAYGTGVASTSGVSSRSGSGEPGRSAGAGSSQHGNPWQVRETMDVVGSDGEQVGTVKAVHGTDFVLDRPMGRDLFVPFSAVRTVDGERVMLGIRASEVDDQHWPNPELTGSNNEGAASR